MIWLHIIKISLLNIPITCKSLPRSICYTPLMSRKKNTVAEIAGWYGTVAILLAYTLVSFSLVDQKGALFQLLNLTGAIGIIIIAVYKKVTQSVVLNIIWAAVAITALIKLIIVA